MFSHLKSLIYCESNSCFEVFWKSVESAVDLTSKDKEFQVLNKHLIGNDSNTFFIAGYSDIYNHYGVSLTGRNI